MRHFRARGNTYVRDDALFHHCSASHAGSRGATITAIVPSGSGAVSKAHFDRCIGGGSVTTIMRCQPNRPTGTAVFKASFQILGDPGIMVPRSSERTPDPDNTRRRRLHPGLRCPQNVHYGGFRCVRHEATSYWRDRNPPTDLIEHRFFFSPPFVHYLL